MQNPVVPMRELHHEDKSSALRMRTSSLLLSQRIRYLSQENIFNRAVLDLCTIQRVGVMGLGSWTTFTSNVSESVKLIDSRSACAVVYNKRICKLWNYAEQCNVASN